MTVIPLVVALLVVGIAKSSEAARGGRIAGRSVLWIVIICTVSAVFGALTILLLTQLFPLPRGTARGLQRRLPGSSRAPPAPLPGIADFFKGVIPANVFAAATNGDMLPLVVFTVLFALALAHISASRRGGRSSACSRRSPTPCWSSSAGCLWVAPLGVFALAFTVGAAAGGAAFAGLGHYIVLISVVGILVTLACYPLAMIAARIGPGDFTRGHDRAAGGRDLDPLVAGLASGDAGGGADDGRPRRGRRRHLPIAVALFRATGPAMNIAVAFYVAHWLGLRAERSPR